METKICTKCGKELPIDQFNWRNKSLGTRRSECKFCHSSYMKNRYQEKKEEIGILKTKLKCAKCGYDKCPSALEFHHINPDEKDATISRMLTNRSNLNDVQKEISKCIVLCSNCHHEFHYLEHNIKNFTLENFLNEEYSPMV